MAWKRRPKNPSSSTEDADSGEKDVSHPQQQKIPISNYWRIVSYGTRTEHVLMLAALVASATSGVTMPLMNIVFGNLVGQFNTFGNPDSSTTESDFRSEVDRFSLIIFGLFLAKFVLCYISMVCLVLICYQ
jgi:ATP-binding cassette, subfamily B (MDR/TAP), member 1